MARNERLVNDMTGMLHRPKPSIIGSLHLIIGVNTFRYCHRLKEERNCAKDIYDLLMPGGICVMIDMNLKFPLFRSLVRDWLTNSASERYLPALEEYASASSAVGFQILEKRNPCWVPHSAGPAMLRICLVLTPVLNWLVPHFAMRSVVISKKPA